MILSNPGTESSSTVEMRFCLLLLLSLRSSASTPVYPTNGWQTATPESQLMSSSSLNDAASWYGSFARPDAFLVIRGGRIVLEQYYRDTHMNSLHDLESGTKSIGALALAHAIKAGHLSLDTNASAYFPGLVGLNPAASSTPLQLKHLLSMSGGSNVTYWQSGGGNPSLTKTWTEGLRQGPPGEVASCTAHGIARKPGSDFVYSFANPAVAEGLLIKTTGRSYAAYLAAHVFPVLGINRTSWRWLGDREGNSQPDGGGFFTARDYAKLAYLMLRNGRWQDQQLLSAAFVAGASQPTPSDWGPCPTYSHFWWRKNLNSGGNSTNAPSRRVPEDTFYAYGGGGQFAVVVPSLDLVVVSLYGGSPAFFRPPADVEAFASKTFFPQPHDRLITASFCDGGFNNWGCWNFSQVAQRTQQRQQVQQVQQVQQRQQRQQQHQHYREHDEQQPTLAPEPRMPSVTCTAHEAGGDPSNDLLAGMMQRVVNAILDE